MIRIACTNCQTVLSIDDAFAGGVCRCQYCGTIQTVPAPAKARAAQSAPTGQGASGGGKTLYRNRARPDGSSGTGLDDLAEAVASSGLSGSGLGFNRAGSKTPAPKANNRAMLLFLGGGAVFVAVVAIGIVIGMSLRSSTPAAPSPASVASNAAPSSADPSTPPAAPHPQFFGMNISAPSVVYVLDRGSATGDVFGSLKAATIKSIISLGSDRKFEVIFWSNDSDAAFPDNSMTYATAANADACRRSIDDVGSFGQTDVGNALKKALARGPGLIILATGKGGQLDDTFTKQVMDIRGSSSVPISTFSLGQSAGSDSLHDIAKNTGGEYHEISSGDLTNFSE